MGSRLEAIGYWGVVVAVVVVGTIGMVVSALMLPILTVFIAVTFSLHWTTLVIVCAATICSWLGLWRNRRMLLLATIGFVVLTACAWSIARWGVSPDLAVSMASIPIGLSSLARQRCSCG